MSLPGRRAATSSRSHARPRTATARSSSTLADQPAGLGRGAQHAILDGQAAEVVARDVDAGAGGGLVDGGDDLGVSERRRGQAAVVLRDGEEVVLLRTRDLDDAVEPLARVEAGAEVEGQAAHAMI